ncbi:aldehyde dehydrogenase (NADP(+)) [Silvibacterium acidisoli]|uniref:aldehyde dehydrogenase (NADP(+)) n=1 Tax=Acidobacteriaceae bacterium ZG23-2 TaxID=2883246 RepID=UPI00406C811C
MTVAVEKLRGSSWIAGVASSSGGASFHGYNPVDGSRLEPAYASASPAEVDSAVAVAEEAAGFLAASSGKDRAKLLRAIADGIDAAAEALIVRANLETALPRPRLTGEVGRTSNQLRLFAGVIEEGSWVNARIDTADPARMPPKPDVRSMLRPLGPVVVFGASNFPLAFSVAGGDTASALAAGNPVIVKAHPAHPGTSELVAQIIVEAVKANGFPAGTFALLFDAGHEVGAKLVQHPAVRAVGFTGSFRGGRALMDLAAKREVPIPVYAEMGSTNPVFILPGALKTKSEALAVGLHQSFTLGGGQFCTKPGMVFVEDQHAADFTAKLRGSVAESPSFSLLTEGIARVYGEGIEERGKLATVTGTKSDEGFAAQGTLLEVGADAFLADKHLSEEVFGPTTLLVHCDSTEQMMRAARELEGHLTATVLGTDEDLAAHGELLRVLETKVGRVIFNAFPTGVEVNHAMVHGGPYPATSDGRSTSVGSLAIFRFARPVAYQGLPQFALPMELRDENPLGLHRLWNGSFEK